MKISEILTMENKNTNFVFLIKEGLFYRAYELLACLFVTYIQNYSVTKKYVKTVKQEIVYIGFPASISVAPKEVLPIAAQDIMQSPQQFKNVIEKIRSYQVATKLPVDAQQFLIEIQHEINGPIS